MTAIATQLAAISVLVAAANAVNDIHSGGGDDEIISAIYNMENDLLTLPNSPTTLSTTTVVQSKSGRVCAAWCRVMPMLAARGYLIG